jgi:hypothetical protein
MERMPPAGSDEARRRRRATATVKKSLRELRLEVKDVDLDCVELIALHGPISPSGRSTEAFRLYSPMNTATEPASGGQCLATEQLSAPSGSILIRLFKAIRNIP